MDYLNNTLLFLQQQNKELKQQLKRMSDLNGLIISQRNEEQRECLARLHQQQINVIREIAADTQQMLRRQLKKANEEIKDMSATLSKQYETILHLKKQIRELLAQKQQLQRKNQNTLEKLNQQQQKLIMTEENFTRQSQKLEQVYKLRQEEIIEKYMSKVELLEESHQQKIFQIQREQEINRKKLELMFDQKSILEEELNKLINNLEQQEIKKIAKIKAFQNQIEDLKRNNQVTQQILNKEKGRSFQLQQKLRQQKKKRTKLQQENQYLKKMCQKIEYSKTKQVQRQKSRTISVCKNLEEHQKYLKNQIEVSKKKQRQYNKSTKMLLNKIKQIEGKSQDNKSSNNTSFCQKTTVKSSKKQFQTYQSISLDNSFNKDSPSVSCFLKNQKIDVKYQIKKKSLKIDTDNHDTLLRFKDLDTPCFQSAKQNNVKKTIKIRK